MKILISQISLGNRNFKQKFERLRKHIESYENDLIDEVDSNIYTVKIPVYLRGKGQDVEIYANITKPIILSILTGFVPSIIVFLIYNSFAASLILFIFGVIISSMTIFIPLTRQINRKVRDWLKKDL